MRGKKLATLSSPTTRRSEKSARTYTLKRTDGASYIWGLAGQLLLDVRLDELLSTVDFRRIGSGEESS